MPKIIENLPERLLREAGCQIKESGYDTMTIRSVAKACGVGVGTVYNYFASKDDLVAGIMLTSWKNCIAAIEASAAHSEMPKPVARCIYDQLLSFSDRYSHIFRDDAASRSFSGSVRRYHGVLRGQLAEPLKKFCRDEFTAEFIAESLLIWTIAGKEFEMIYSMIEKLL